MIIHVLKLVQYQFRKLVVNNYLRGGYSRLLSRESVLYTFLNIMHNNRCI